MSQCTIEPKRLLGDNSETILFIPISEPKNAAFFIENKNKSILFCGH